MKFTRDLFLILAISIIVVAGYSCRKDKHEGVVVNDSDLVEHLLSNAMDTLVIDNQKLILETELYRDFFPGEPYNSNTRLVASVYIVNTDSSTITSEFTVSKLYIINQNDVWISQPEDHNDNNPLTYKFYLLSKNGPEWETGITVNVIASITNLVDNSEHFLIARDQIIKQVE